MDMYPDSGSKDKAHEGESGDSPEIESPEEGLLPISMFPDDVKPGYTCKIKVVGVSGDEVRVIKDHKKDEDKSDDDSDEDEDKSEDKPKKRKRHRDYSNDDEFLSDRQVAMMNMGPPGTGPGMGAM